MPIDFPNTPTNGQVYTQGNRSWTYNSSLSSWEGGLNTVTGNLIAQNSNAVNITGGTITGLSNLTASTATISGNLIVDTNTLFVDSVNNRLGIGTVTPTKSVEIRGRADTDIRLYLDVETAYYPQIYGVNAGGSASLVEFPNGWFINNPSLTVYNTVNTFSIVGDLNVNVGAPSHASVLYVGKTSQNVGIGTSSPSAKLDVNGTANVVGNTTIGGTLVTTGKITANGQGALSALAANDVMTQDLSLKREITYGWSQLPFIATGESRSTSDMTQLNYFLTGTLVYGVNALSGDCQWLTIDSIGQYYPQGSGAPYNFSTPFTIFFEFDANYDSANALVKTDYSLEYIHGLATPATYPTSSDKCLVVRMRFNSNVVSNNDGSRTIEAAIHDGTNIYSSGVISLTEGFLSQKNKMCIVWNGSTLSVYLNTWSATIGSPFNMTLAASVSATVSGSMTQRSSYICNRLYQDLSAGNPSTWIQSPKFIREAVHPI